jgi:hydrogenase/urease accessory protein HupE
MRPLALAAFVTALLAIAQPAGAHPAPFSYVNAQLAPGRIELTLVVHVFDVAHDLRFEPPERLFDPQVLAERAAAIQDMFAPRLHILVDGRMLRPPVWSGIEPLLERQSLRMHATVPLENAPGVVVFESAMFTYDPVHQTFVNVYEMNDLRLQAILDVTKTRVEYFSGSRQGAFAVFQKFVPSGFEHILIGPDHLLFLTGLLLLGGSLRRLTLIVTAFTIAHSITLSLAALNILHPSARIVEPAIALSIIYVGIDNLMVKGGRDVRAWIAFGFGFIHGFGFANVLQSMDLPRRALGWSLFSFNLGVELGQLLVVLAVGSAIVALHARQPNTGRRLATVGSIIVSVAGAYWFIQRVFFPGGIA